MRTLPLVTNNFYHHNPEVASNKLSADKKLKFCSYHHILTDDCIPQLDISAKEGYPDSLYIWPLVPQFL